MNGHGVRVVVETERVLGRFRIRVSTLLECCSGVQSIKKSIGVDATERESEHGIEICGIGKQEAEQITQCKDRDEKTSLHGSANNSVDDCVSLAEARTRASESVGQGDCDENVCACLESEPAGYEGVEYVKLGHKVQYTRIDASIESKDSTEQTQGSDEGSQHLALRQNQHSMTQENLRDEGSNRGGTGGERNSPGDNSKRRWVVVVQDTEFPASVHGNSAMNNIDAEQNCNDRLDPKTVVKLCVFVDDELVRH